VRISRVAVVSVAAATAIAAAVIPVGLQRAGASTSACGSSCTSPYNDQDGTGNVLTVSGTNVEMAAASSTSTAQDWTPEFIGDVYQAVEAGLIPSRLNLLYSDASMYEFQYAPGGSPSGECLGNTSTDPGMDSPYNVPTTSVVLVTCGVTAATLWAVDDQNYGNVPGYDDLISVGYEEAYTYLAQNSGTADNLTSPFAEPEVLTYSSKGVGLAQLSEIGGIPSAGQLWGDYLTSAQQAVEAKKEAAQKSS
jgi:hypothetical protein